MENGKTGQGINWQKEKEQIEERKEFLKLEAGTHKVEFLDNGIKVERTFDNNGEPETKQQVQFAVMYKGNAYLFAVNLSSSSTSLFGQIAMIAAEYGNIKDRTITIMVQGKGKEKRYTLPEALELETKHKELNKVKEEIVK